VVKSYRAALTLVCGYLAIGVYMAWRLKRLECRDITEDSMLEIEAKWDKAKRALRS
jgi:ABC-type uncharacterized transport system permease subunit